LDLYRELLVGYVHGNLRVWSLHGIDYFTVRDLCQASCENLLDKRSPWVRESFCEVNIMTFEELNYALDSIDSPWTAEELAVLDDKPRCCAQDCLEIASPAFCVCGADLRAIPFADLQLHDDCGGVA
jgi:hypothetical protein